MCGRFALKAQAAILAEKFGLTHVHEVLAALYARYNIAPSQQVLAIRNTADGGRSREPALLRWGLVPSWADDITIGNRMANARSETAADKPAFRGAMRHRRCLVPADCFYEWQKPDAVGKGGRKQPYMVRMRSGEPFALAGIWETWQDADGNELETCAVLTTRPNQLMHSIHDRMPVILHDRDYDRWLDTSPGHARGLEDLYEPFESDAMEALPISTLVNKPSVDDPRIQEPVAGQSQGGLFEG
ncbi:MAG: hypothetical protein GC164_10605 [Phycisphaera sp.]|nr:hypothetical protein [Phycisphaera sp.]